MSIFHNNGPKKWLIFTHINRKSKAPVWYSTSNYLIVCTSLSFTLRRLVFILIILRLIFVKFIVPVWNVFLSPDKTDNTYLRRCSFAIKLVLFIFFSTTAIVRSLIFSNVFIIPRCLPSDKLTELRRLQSYLVFIVCITVLTIYALLMFLRGKKPCIPVLLLWKLTVYFENF